MQGYLWEQEYRESQKMENKMAIELIIEKRIK